MRKKPHGKLIKSAHAVEREYRVMAALGPRGFPVPRMLFLCEDAGVIGTPFYLMDFCRGRVNTDNGLGSVARADRPAAMRSIVDTLAALHRTDIDAAGLGEYGRRGGFYPRQIATMERVSDAQAQAGPVPQIAARPQLLDWFRANLPADRTTIVHGDFKPDNCILAPDSPSVLAVVDWELSTLGHPLSDLANLCLGYYFKPGFARNVPPMQDVHRHYCSRTGTPYPIEGWRFAVAFAFFRLSVIIQGIAARAARGQASNARDGAPEISKRADAIARMGLDVALGAAEPAAAAKM